MDNSSNHKTVTLNSETRIMLRALEYYAKVLRRYAVKYGDYKKIDPILSQVLVLRRILKGLLKPKDEDDK